MSADDAKIELHFTLTPHYWGVSSTRAGETTVRVLIFSNISNESDNDNINRRLKLPRPFLDIDRQL